MFIFLIITIMGCTVHFKSFWWP